MREHWHVHLNPGEEDPFVTMSIYEALDATLGELQDLWQNESDAAHALFHVENWEDCARAYAKRDELNDLIATVRHPGEQHAITERYDRAPLFRNWHIDQQRGDWGEDSKLYQTALWVKDQVNSGTDLEIYACTSDDIIGDEDGNWHESYFPAGG